MMSNPTDLIETRLKTLEDRIFGSNKSQLSSETPNIVDQLLHIDSKLKELTAGKERFNHCHQRLIEMHKWMDPQYIENAMVNDASKYEEIIAAEESIRQQSHDFERIQQLEVHLDSPHIRNCDELRPKLEKIRLFTLNHDSGMKQLSDDTMKLLLEYNQWINSVKAQLSFWDEKITKLENEKKNGKKSKLDFD